LQTDFTKGNDHYPETREHALMFCDKYTKTITPVVASEGTAFAQKSKGTMDPKSGESGEIKRSSSQNDSNSMELYNKDAFF
jgi:hypothetical protein